MLNSEINMYISKMYEESGNYKIIFNNCQTRKCIIFFSGNGIYFPDTINTFVDVIIEKDRYEWENIMRNPLIQQSYQMVILVRDINKKYYQKGINSSINSIDKVVSFLREKTIGYEITTCGNSAGGYMATLVGNFLDAQCIYSFGGQWNLNHEKESFWDVSINKQYFDITRYAKENVMWFYSAYNEADLLQKECLGEYIEDISAFAMNSKYHGYLLLSPCYKNLLTMPMGEMKNLGMKYKSKVISQRRMAKELLHGKELRDTCIKDIISKHKSLQYIQSILIKIRSCIYNVVKKKEKKDE